MIKINLLPVKEAKRKTTIQNQLVVAVIVLLVVLAGIGYMIWTRKSEISDLQNQQSQKQNELTELTNVQKKVEQFKKDNENLAQKIGVIAGLEGGRDWYLQIIDQISDSIPREVWIDSLRTSTGRATGETQWEFGGGALEKDQISNFMSNMEKKNKYFGVISLKRVERAKGGTGTPMSGPYYKYEMSIQIKSPPKAEPGAS
jgi:type IV pilus assembly protein PilN